MLNDRNISQSDMIDILAKGVRRAMCRQNGCVSNAHEWRAGEGSSAQTDRAAVYPTPVLDHVGRKQGFRKTDGFQITVPDLYLKSVLLGKLTYFLCPKKC